MQAYDIKMSAKKVYMMIKYNTIYAMSCVLYMDVLYL